MRLPARLLPIVVSAALAPAAQATQCYSMYDARNTLVYQSTTAPVDLSGSASDAMRRRFPSRALVIADSGVCREVGTGPASAATLRASNSLAYDAAGDTASPLVLTGSDASDAPIRSVRGAVRGNVLAVPGAARSAPASRR